jgi:hypothetical protein
MMTMTSDLFHHFKTAANYGDSITSSAARAQLKVWDQQNEFTYEIEYETGEEEVPLVCTANGGVAPDHRVKVKGGWKRPVYWEEEGALPEEKWKYIKNPRLTTEEVWKLCADESSDERADDYGRYDPADCWDGYDYYNDGYDDYDNKHDEHFGHLDDEDMMWQDYRTDWFEIHAQEQAGDKWCEDAAEEASVWQTTRDEITRFEESCDPLQPEPRPLITDHHNRKNLIN